MKKTITILCASVCIAGVMAPIAEAIPTVTFKKDTQASLPEIWKSVPTAQRLQCVRAAEMDATRILAENIMGIWLDGNTTIKDLAQVDDTIRGMVATTIKGVKTVGKPTYHEDGRIEIIRTVKTRSLVESVITKLGSHKSNVVRETITADIDALGNAALPGTDGHDRVMAKRAAEIDAYRRLSERAAGVLISSDTTVKNFAQQSDEIKAAFTNCIKGAEIKEISYLEDNSAEVTITLKMGPLVRLINRTITADGKTLDISEETEQLTLEETGVGAPPSAGSSASTTEIDLIITTTLETTITAP